MRPTQFALSSQFVSPSSFFRPLSHPILMGLQAPVSQTADRYFSTIASSQESFDLFLAGDDDDAFEWDANSTSAVEDYKASPASGRKVSDPTTLVDFPLDVLVPNPIKATTESKVIPFVYPAFATDGDDCDTDSEVEDLASPDFHLPLRTIRTLKAVHSVEVERAPHVRPSYNVIHLFTYNLQEFLSAPDEDVAPEKVSNHCKVQQVQQENETVQRTLIQKKKKVSKMGKMKKWANKVLRKGDDKL